METTPSIESLSDRDRRRSERQMLIADARLVPEHPGQESAMAVLSDMSYLGVGFHTQTPLPIGSRYHLDLEAGPMHWNSRVHIVSCVPQPNGTFGVGAEFIGNKVEQRLRAAA